MNRMHRNFKHLAKSHKHHQTDKGVWMFRDDCGDWYQFNDDEHMANTIEAGVTVRFFTMDANHAYPNGMGAE